MTLTSVSEAKLEHVEGAGLSPASDGWFVVNVADARSLASRGLGAFVPFEGREHRFTEYGINIHVLQPGEPNCMYHREDGQESFLVLDGECLLIVEGQERRLRRWDFFHSAPGTAHVLVGAGDGPCAVLMVGSRRPGASLLYPVDPVAQRHGAGVDEETSDPRQAYAAFTMPAPGPLGWTPPA